MLFRVRRYRVYIIFAIIAVGLLYHFTNIGDFQSAGQGGIEGLKNLGFKEKLSSSNAKADAGRGDSSTTPATKVPPPPPAADNAKQTVENSYTKSPATSPNSPIKSSPEDGAVGVPPVVNGGNRAAPPAPKASSSEIPKAVSSDSTDLPAAVRPSSNKTVAAKPEPVSGFAGGQGRLEVNEETTIPKIHWTPSPEHFPVPSDSLITLPTGKPKTIPKIQHDFSSIKSKSERVDQDKLDRIKDAFLFSWNGYKEYAWRQDELSPSTGKYKNPFNGWGATLVDSLDTLWMMDLKDEFEEAVEAVKKIDFTTSMRNDIPLFETVIRYLGGLVAAYDVSEQAYKSLLDKAVELAEVLIGAFDTPNRMPMTFYLWKPAFVSQPHRARTRVVLAEIGSLSLEFTRLAQITKESKYYDAIARITNELEIWQTETKLPGLWPLSLDASGCKKASSKTPKTSKTQASDRDESASLPEKAAAYRAAAAANPGKAPDASPPGAAHGDKVPEKILTDPRPPPDAGAEVAKQAAAAGVTTDKSRQGAALSKREEAGPQHLESVETKKAENSLKSECEPQGLASPPFASSEDFGIGGEADSTYEYLPKEYLLLGGLEPKYQNMYELAADAVTENLLFRPMIPDEKRSIRQVGLVKRGSPSSSESVLNRQSKNFKPDGTHLSCFAGGMFALGSRIFDRKQDFEIAKQLTDGCVWAYEATKLGIMPETFHALPCKDVDDCPWNRTAWEEELDPQRHSREQQRLNQQAQQKVLAADEKLPEEAHPGVDAVLAQPAGSTEKGGSSALAGSKEPLSAGAAGKAPGNADSEIVSESTDKAVSKDDVEKPKVGTSTGEVKREDDGVKKPLTKRQLGEVDISKVDTKAGDKAELKSESKSASSLKEGGDSQTARKSSGESDEGTTGTAQSTKEKVSSTDESSQPKALKPPEGDGSSAVDSPKKPAAQKDVGTTSEYPKGSSKTNGTGAPIDFKQPPILTHEEYVRKQVEEEGIPEGMTRITGRKYLLRPEAIESVFIMYRATGDGYWRDKGWKMYKAIESATNGTYGASSISDVTKAKPKMEDKMESFWLAETLKYFYLLYSDPAKWSLDDYVLNTEAHPFRRPA